MSIHSHKSSAKKARAVQAPQRSNGKLRVAAILEAAAAVIAEKGYEGATMAEAEQKEFLRPTLEQFDRESSVYYSSARLWDDGVLDPVETRAALALGIAASMNAPIPAHANFGVFRM